MSEFQPPIIRVKYNKQDGRIVVNIGGDWWFCLSHDLDDIVSDFDTQIDDSWTEYTSFKES